MGKNKNINLVVEDSAFIFNRLLYLLTGSYNILEIKIARNFTEVSGILEKNQPDIILLDISSIDTNELSLLSILKDLYPKVSITILSGNFNKYYLNQFKKIGAGFYIEDISDVDRAAESLMIKKKTFNAYVV
ncbi:MAG TPA: response regulator [Puia sp.]|nr:response regulator [Puia sp.]